MGRGATGAIAALGDLGGNQGPGAGKFYGSAWTVSARSRSNIHRIYVFTYLRIYVYPTGSQGPQALDPRQAVFGRIGSSHAGSQEMYGKNSKSTTHDTSFT